MSWKPKDRAETIEFTEEPCAGLVIQFQRKMSIRELNEIQAFSTETSNANMEQLCEVIAKKITSWNYEGVKPSADALMDMPHDIASAITGKIMETIVGTTENLVESSPNGLNLEAVSGVTVAK